MAFDPAVATWLDNWSEDGTDITVPIATFSELTAAEADAVTGDIRKVLFAICEKLWSVWTATATADRPSKMTLYRSTQTNENTNVTRKTFQFIFDTEVSGQEVSDES